MVRSVQGGQGNVILIGMPAAGKSTVGVVLAKMLNLEFVDADLVIQQRFGETLQNLIDAQGAEAFIQMEGQVLQSLDEQNALISTGGSAVYSSTALEHLAQGGTVVYLQATLEELERRLEDFSERGVVMRQEGAMSLAALYAERVPLYEACADITVDVTGLTIAQAATAVRRALGL